MSNYMVKVTDAKLPDVRKALQAAGIEVRSIILLHKEEVQGPEGGEDAAPEGEAEDKD